MIAAAAALGITAHASATSFAMTTEIGDGFGFVDTDTISLQGEIGKVIAYTVWKTDQPVPAAARIPGGGPTYAATASELWFQCSTKHFIATNLFMYDEHGRLVGQYDKPVLGERPIPPQTGVYDQYSMVCGGRKPEHLITNFNDTETPLQTLIRAGRATLNDPRYVP